MKKLLHQIKLYNLGGIFIAILIAGMIYLLSYVLMHNPYQPLRDSLFKTVSNIRSYYRDSPGYWKLDTNAAKEASLIDEKLFEYKEFELHIGQSDEGDLSMPYNTTFDITLENLNKSACIGLSELGISDDDILGLHSITIINDSGQTEFSWGNEEHKLPISKWSTRNICQSTNNKIMWTFE